MKIELWPIEKVIPYARNPRRISEAAISKVKASIKEFGVQQPIVVDKEGVIIVGHTRYAALQQLEVKEVPVHVADKLTPAQVKSYRIMDNRSHLESSWDDDLLKLELTELDDWSADLELTGFDEGELQVLMAPVFGGLDIGLTDEDETPDVQADSVTKPGDVWVLDNRHRLCCGDSTNSDDVARLLNGVTPLLMVTDPPYGVEYDPDWRNRADRANGKPYGARAVGQVRNDDRADWREAWALFPGDVAYVWHAGRHAASVQISLEVCQFEIRCQIIWAKSRFVISRGNYHWQHEPCWYAVKEGKTGHWSGDRSQSTLWTIDHQKSETGHGTQKPVECMRRPIINNSAPGQPVYDPFVGSGTTIIAAETTGRVALAMEINPEYVDVSIRRWQSFTGKSAVLEGDGRTFDEISKERLAKAA